MAGADSFDRELIVYIIWQDIESASDAICGLRVCVCSDAIHKNKILNRIDFQLGNIWKSENFVLILQRFKRLCSSILSLMS